MPGSGAEWCREPHLADAGPTGQIRDKGNDMIRRSSPGRAAPRRLALRALVLVLVLALGATACGSAEVGPTLTNERPPPPTSTTSAPAPAPAVDPLPAAPTTTAVPLSRTTEPTILVTSPPGMASEDELGIPVLPPVLPDVVSEEMSNPDLTRLPEEQLPPPPPPTTAPTTVPPWQPVTILTSRDDVNSIIPVYDAPDGTRLAFPDGDLWSYTFRRNRLVARVLQGTEGDEWVQVELPVRPNGVRGWVRAEHFNWSTVSHHVLINVSDRSVALYEGDNLITSTRAIVGKPATPTPTLSGFLVEKLPNHSQQNGSIVLGDWILMLSFFSEVLNSFNGGLPRIALHGTHIPERVGEALSNGCIRIPNDIVEAIARQAPLGTVVNIVA
ncbi:MAG: L,D-transpeptidase [Acidimicrobiia bacterium]|nr:L,D-transpeptidase [Acidimicrobiia bacterium]MYC46306.1 L,D-transpeptidase [Acidimicrobiia bacterium]